MGRAPSGAERIEDWLSFAGPAYHLIKPMVEFLSHPLDAVTGDPDQLRAKATAWRTAADKLGKMADIEESGRLEVLGCWEGPAADAFAADLAELCASIRDAVDHFKGTAELLEISAEGAKQAQDLVEQIIRELIAWLIITIVVALASAWITAGASLAAGTAAGWAEAATAGTRAAQVGLRLANLLRKVAAFLKKMSEFARAYKLTKIRSAGVKNWMSARYASKAGYQLLATNWVIKQTIAKPSIGPAINKLTGANKGLDLPQLL